MKKIVFLFVMAVIFTACCNETCEKATTTDSTSVSTTTDTAKVTVDTTATTKVDSLKK
jgi:hypothetical protein